MTEGRAPVEGGTLHYEVAGDGPGIVLIHPGLWDSRTWDVTFPVFAEHHRVLRYDMRGYGRSDRPTGAFSHVEDLRAVMEAAGIDRAAIVGNSIGGAVAIEFVLEHPEMATALVAIAPGLDGFIATFGEPDFDWDTAEAPIEAAVEAGDLDLAVELEMELWPRSGRRIRPAPASDRSRSRTRTSSRSTGASSPASTPGRRHGSGRSRCRRSW
jgi:pimeloyl-ACP methyl ester carboxylesterase